MEASLAELMKPDRMVKQARYENALRAVTMAYQYAKDLGFLEAVCIKGSDGNNNYIEPLPEAKVAHFTKVARMLIPIIEVDLNNTLNRLD